MSITNKLFHIDGEWGADQEPLLKFEMQLVLSGHSWLVSEQHCAVLVVPLEVDLWLIGSFHRHGQAANDERVSSVDDDLVGELGAPIGQSLSNHLDLLDLLLSNLLAASYFTQEGTSLDLRVVVANIDLIGAGQLWCPLAVDGHLFGHELDLGLGGAFERTRHGRLDELFFAGHGEDAEGQRLSTLALLQTIARCVHLNGHFFGRT